PLQAVARDRGQHQPRIDHQLRTHLVFDICVLQEQRDLGVLRAGGERLVDVRRVGLDEEREVRRDLAAEEKTRAADEDVLRVTARRGILKLLRLRLQEDAELQIDVVIDLDRHLCRGGRGEEQGENEKL